MILKNYLNADWARLNEAAGRDATKRKWSCHFSPRFAPVTLIRLAQRSHEKNHRILAKFFGLLNFLIFSIEVPASLKIGPGLVIPHPQGTVLGAQEIGADVTIFHQVTLGGKAADFDYNLAQRPKVCDRATLSVGAKILGPVVIGEGATIGANAVVLDNIPAGATAVGIPARVIT